MCYRSKQSSPGRSCNEAEALGSGGKEPNQVFNHSSVTDKAQSGGKLKSREAMISCKLDYRELVTFLG